MLRDIPRASLPLLAFTLLCGFQCDSEVPIGQTDGSVGDGGASACVGENPAGCTTDTECEDGQVCTPAGLASSCSCDEMTGSWFCSRDTAGGTCGPASECTEPDPSGCTMDSECGAGLRCATGTRPSECSCNGEMDVWGCTRDLGAGDCVPDSCPDSSDPDVYYEMCATMDFICEDGDVALPPECGCGCMPAPEPDCGTLSCDYATQYCEEVIPGVMGAETTYMCKTLPESCDSPATCPSCFPGEEAFCSERPEGIRYSIALP